MAKTPKKGKGDSSEPIPNAFVVVIDTREKYPFRFLTLRSDADRGRRPLVVETVVRGLPTGDYSLVGYESQIAVERKSLADLYGTISQNRERFERELERLNAMEYAAVVIESNWQEILTTPPPYSKLPPKNVFRSILSWQQRFTRVHWWPTDGRRLAEIVTFRILERFWKNRQMSTDITKPE